MLTQSDPIKQRIVYYEILMESQFWQQLKSSRGQFCQHFYANLLRVQIPKAQKDTDDLTVFFALLVSALVKAAPKMLVKLTQGLTIVCCPTLNHYLRNRDESEILKKIPNLWSRRVARIENQFPRFQVRFRGHELCLNKPNIWKNLWNLFSLDSLYLVTGVG